MFKKIIGTMLASIFAVGIVTSVAGCNTMQGVGEDVEHGGQKLENAAAKAKS